MMVISGIATTIVLLLGYSRVVEQVVTVGVLLTFLQYTVQLWRPVRNLTEKFNLIQTALTAGERIVDVLEARQKVLILAHAPHPDLSALKQSITAGQNNEIEVQYINSFSGNIRDFDMVILHQLPSRSNNVQELLSTLATAKIPTWFIVGDQSGFPAVNDNQQLVNLRTPPLNCYAPLP